MNFENKVIVITGAGGGIGKAAAKKFKELGAKLCLVDISEELLKSAYLELNLNPNDAMLFKVDVSKEEEVKLYVDKTIEKFGKIDVFVNNAGVEGKVKPIVETDKKDLDFLWGVNVYGVYFGLKHVIPHMIKQKGGSVINTASIAGFVGSAGIAPYVASKHAVIGITKTAALEYAPYNIRVNAVCPGPVDNRMMRSIEEGAAPGHGEDVKNNFIKQIPLGRYATNEEVADLILFLASDNSKYITAQSYKIDGGMVDKV